jgi:hypothetical protein
MANDGFFSKNYKKVADTGILDPAGIYNQPKDQWFGGGAGELERLREGYAKGQDLGQIQIFRGEEGIDQGLKTLGSAQGTAAGLGVAASNYGVQGQGIGQAGMLAQDAAMGRQNDVTLAMLGTAAQQGPSAAQAQMQMGLDQSRRAMMAQAASARGGNQAAAMRNAQAQGSQMALDVNQQAGVLRAQEANAQRQALLGAQAQAAGIYGGQQQMMGQRAGMGYGMQGQGLGLQQGANAQLADIGNTQAGIGQARANMGVQQQANYLGAETEANKAQLEASQSGEEAKNKSKGGILGGIGSALGGIF